MTFPVTTTVATNSPATTTNELQKFFNTVTLLYIDVPDGKLQDGGGCSADFSCSLTMAICLDKLEYVAMHFFVTVYCTFRYYSYILQLFNTSNGLFTKVVYSWKNYRLQ